MAGNGPAPAGLNSAPAMALVAGSSTGIGMALVYQPPIGGADCAAAGVETPSVTTAATTAADVRKSPFIIVSSRWEAWRRCGRRRRSCPRLRRARLFLPKNSLTRAARGSPIVYGPGRVRAIEIRRLRSRRCASSALQAGHAVPVRPLRLKRRRRPSLGFSS